MVDNRKESFQLLHFSEDSKSISELEAPEIIPPRKRKIRRKTRNTGNHTGRNIDGEHHHSHHNNHNDDTPAVCHNLGLWIAIFMSCGWLLILSYMTTVVYTENRRLETQISKLSVNSLNVPDILQKWHETAKYLEGNQTVVNEKISNIQRRLDGLEMQVVDVRNSVTKQNDLIANQEKMNVQQTVGTFGAKIRDISLEVDQLVDRVKQIKFDTEQNKNNITNVSSKLENSTLQLNRKISNVTNTQLLLTNTTKYFKSQISNLTTDLVSINDTLNARVKTLTDAIHQNQIQLENVTSRTTEIMSLQPHPNDKELKNNKTQTTEIRH